ncbi:hypothetical protein NGB36_02165 [Streptomyces sp. RB6PN25]|uniref:Gram-positive cocci surface proteins LPxTG domain-containing protein n=1 Tax=Streptomyces humicola TaxID=2953240 RepID=A0ABT1PR55_9ACTN|nr:hypothetical protein [Streptomyces humicola]MCQ4079435.1 hypothetical protein [Streptomyces humicola]
MRRTRFTIATLSMAASAMVLGMPAATAASVSPTSDNGQVRVVGRHHHHRHHHHHRTEHRHQYIRWHHRCGPGWDSGWVHASERDRGFRRGGGRWIRGWISTCSWRRGGEEGGYRSSRRVVTRYVAPRVYTTSRVRGSSTTTRPVGGVRAGVGGSVNSPNLPELALGGSLAALGLAGFVGAARRRSSAR